MAAKTIKISSDGSNWYTLPGNTGELSEEAASVEDTIFGQTFESAEVGLISWTISANAHYKGFAGYRAKLKETGTSTAITDEETDDLGDDVYQITDSAKRILDRSVDVVVNDDGTPISSSGIEWVDHLFGKVKLAAEPSGTVTIDANYLPTSDFAGASSFTLTQSAEAVQKTDYPTANSNGGYHVYEPGLRTVTLELSGFYSANNDHAQRLKDREELVIEVDPSGTGNSICRGFFKTMTRNQSGDVGQLEEEGVNFALTVPDDDQLYSVFSWEHSSNTTLSQAVRELISAWLDESLTNVQYLEDGSTGIEGEGVITDLSLEGSLEGMNTFSVELQGSGSQTDVT